MHSNIYSCKNDNFKLKKIDICLIYAYKIDSDYTLEQLYTALTSTNNLFASKNRIWLVGCFGFNGPLRQYFSLYLAVSQREGEREEKG